MGISSTPTFAVKDGEDCVTITNQHGDTTSSKVSHIKRERPDEWAALAPAYDAWKADAKAQKEAKAADEAKTKEADKAKVHAEAESVRAEKAREEADKAAKAGAKADDDDDDDDDKNGPSTGSAGTRRTLAKGYKK